jgi:riboflavin transporter FmnP
MQLFPFNGADGSMLCPMHIPALLCGFVCGWPWGLAVGFLSPLLRSLIFGMPPMFVAIPMAFEMAVYGAAAGFLYRTLPKKLRLYPSLLIAMVLGRLVWGGVRFLMAGLQNTTFTLELFLAGAVLEAVPGIILQLFLIPIVVLALEKAKLILNNKIPPTYKTGAGMIPAPVSCVYLFLRRCRNLTILDGHLPAVLRRSGGIGLDRFGENFHHR